MPYIDRDLNGRIVGIFNSPQFDGQEFTEEAVALHLPEKSAQQQIEELEREFMLPKATREFMLTFMEATAIEQGASLGLTAEQALAALRQRNPGYQKVKALDEQIDALRAAQ